MDDQPPKLIRIAVEASIDDFGPTLGTENAEGTDDDPLLRPYRPLIVSPIAHRVQLLASELFLMSSGNFGYTDAPSGGELQGLRLLQEAPGTRLSDATIRSVEDHCDQLLYWALAESRFPEHPSVLVSVPEVVVTLLSMLTYSRSPVVLAALRVLECIVAHPMSAKQLGNQAVYSLQSVSHDGPTEDASPTGHHWVRTDLLQLLYVAACTYPNKVDVQVPTITIARLVAPHALERFLTSDLVSAVLAAMAGHPRCIEVQREGVLLFDATVRLPRDDPRDAPPSILFVHVGKIVEFLLTAARAVDTSSDVCHAVVRTLLVMAERPENDDELGATSCVHLLVTVLKNHLKNRDLVQDALSTLACMVRWMDAAQRRSLATAIRNVMMVVTVEDVLAHCCVVLHTTLARYEFEMESYAHAHSSDEGNAEADIEKLFDELEGLRAHCAKEKLPQLIHIAVEHFGEEAADLRTAANMALHSLTTKRRPTRAVLVARFEEHRREHAGSAVDEGSANAAVDRTE
jgi:hypothetical protein